VGRLLMGGRLGALEAEQARLGESLSRLRGAVEQLAGERAAPRGAVSAFESELASQHARIEAGAAIRAELDHLKDRLKLVSRSLPLAFSVPAATGGEGTEISVIVPVRNRARLLPRTMESVLRQSHAKFELLVVDDGSTDGTVEVARSFGSDARVRVFCQPWSGAGAARNRGLREARGDLVAYLDSDVVMEPGYLAALAAAYAADPGIGWSYAGRLIEMLEDGLVFVQFEPFERHALERQNFIDTNVIAHRRGLEERFGGWDESLSMTSDWDLALRWSAREEPRPLPVLACRYDLGRPDQITYTQPHGWDNYRVIRRHRHPLDLDLRALYVVERYPELTGTAVEQEIQAARASGVHVEVWSPSPPALPLASDVPVHRGSLADAVSAVHPALLQVHGAGTYFGRVEELAATGLPCFVRCHGDDLDRATLARLEADPAVRNVFLSPPQVEAWAVSPKVIRTWVGFCAELHYPETDQDRRLVFRAAAARPERRLEILFDLARRVPELRFVLAAGGIEGQRGWLDRLIALNREAGSPVDLRIDLPREEAAALSRRAGIYLHTHALEYPFESPISVAEALASGSYALLPRCPAAESFAGDAADFYGSLEEAEHRLRATLDWGEVEWRRRSRRAIDHAFDHLEAGVAILPILKNWVACQGRPWPE